MTKWQKREAALLWIVCIVIHNKWMYTFLCVCSQFQVHNKGNQTDASGSLWFSFVLCVLFRSFGQYNGRFILFQPEDSGVATAACFVEDKSGLSKRVEHVCVCVCVCVYKAYAPLWLPRDTRRRCNRASRLAESQTERAGAVWELSILQIYMFWCFSPPVFWQLEFAYAEGWDDPVEIKNKRERKRKDVQTSPHRTRPLNWFLLKRYDILASSNRITQIIFGCWVKPSAHPPAALQRQQAAVSGLMNVLLSNRPAHEKEASLLIRNSLLALVGFRRRERERERERESERGHAQREDRAQCHVAAVSYKGGGSCCRSAWSADLRSTKNNQLLFAHQKLLETTWAL